MLRRWWDFSGGTETRPKVTRLIRRSILLGWAIAGFALSACTQNRVAVPLRPDLANPARMVCVDRGDRPHLPAEYVIDWAHVATVDQAHAEHDAYVRTVRTREGVVTGYLLETEARLFTCSNNAQFWRSYWNGLPH